MAEVAPLPTPAADPIATQIATAQAAVAQAIAQLALDQVTADLDPTAANLQAVANLQERVDQKEAELASLYAQQAALPPASSGGTGTIGGGGVPGITSPEPSLPPGLAKWNVPPTIPILGVVESGAPLAEGWWEEFVAGHDDLVNLNGTLDSIIGTTLGDTVDVAVIEVGGGLVAAFADLPGTIIGLGMLILVYLIGKLLVFVGKHFPNPNILGWHPLNFIRAGIQDTGQALVDVADTFLHPLLALLLTPVHLVKALFQRVVNAIAGAYRQVDHLFTHTIPDSATVATTNANTYTDVSLTTLQADQAAALARVAQDQNEANAVAKLEAAGAPASMFGLLADAIQARLAEDQTTAAEIATEIATELPLEVVTAANAATATEDNALAATAVAYQAQINSLNARIGANKTTIATAQAIIVADQAALVHEEMQIPPDAAAITSLQKQIAQSRTQIETSITAIEDLESQITGISDTLGKVHTTQALRTINHTPTEIPEVAAVATLVAVMARELWKLKTKVDTCMMDTCDTTSPNYYKNLLLAWLAGLTDVAEISYVAAAIADPVNVANAQAPLFEAIDTKAVALLDFILGL